MQTSLDKHLWNQISLLLSKRSVSWVYGNFDQLWTDEYYSTESNWLSQTMWVHGVQGRTDNTKWNFSFTRAFEQLFQVVGNPLQMTLPNTTQLFIKFDNPSILTEKEEEAYSIGSLVADCGGVLGLFIGFNFIMVWDVIHTSMRKLKFERNMQWNI